MSSHPGLLPRDDVTCYNSTTYQLVSSTLTLAKLLFVVPLLVSVVFVGWQRQRGVVGRSMSYSHFFMYNMVVIETASFLSVVLYSWVSVMWSDVGVKLANAGFILSLPGQLYYHCLTCVERYVAVIHPVAYKRLCRKSTAKLVQSAVLLGCLLLCGALCVINEHFYDSVTKVLVLCLVFSLAVVLFCSASVLRALKRDGPGEGAVRVDRTKLRAFRIIVAILSAILLWCVGYFVIFELVMEALVNHKCLATLTGVAFGLPGSLVLPLLFLHRAEKLLCCSYNDTE